MGENTKLSGLHAKPWNLRACNDFERKWNVAVRVKGLVLIYQTKYMEGAENHYDHVPY